LCCFPAFFFSLANWNYAILIFIDAGSKKMKTSGKLFALTPRNGRLARPNGIFGPDDNFSDVSSTSSSDEDSPNDWVDPLWIPDDNLCQYPSSQVKAQRRKKKLFFYHHKKTST